MTNFEKILTIQDISCFGQCSLTVALPILSACGIETAILPSAVLSTHTGGFTGYTCRDLTDDIPLIEKHWKKEGISFDAIYTGYLGSTRQIDYVKDIFKTLNMKNGLSIVDPAMADHGKLYPAFNAEFVDAMKTLCFSADIILPNITEACLITDTPYPERYDEPFIKELLNKLVEHGAKTIILKGIGYDPKTTGVIILENGETKYYKHQRISKDFHGTGDVFASAFTGALGNGISCYNAAKIAADFTVRCIENTADDPSHWYGVKFEKTLPELISAINHNKD